MIEEQPAKPSRLIRTLKRFFVGLLLLIVIVITGAIIFLGDIAEYLIEKNDTKYTGREIELADLKVKLFSGVISLDGLQFKEANGSDDFIFVRGIYADIKPLELLSNRLIVEEAGIDRMITNISHSNRIFNFKDLIDRFYPIDTTSTAADSASLDWEWEVTNIHIDSCRFNYTNLILDSRITVDPFHLTIPLMSSSVDTFSAQTNLSFLNGGKIASNLAADLGTGDYVVDLNWDRVPIDYLFKYLHDYVDVSDFGGYISLDLDAAGNLTNMTDVEVEGNIDAENMRILDAQQDTLLSFEAFGTEIIKADYADNIYRFGSTYLKSPFFRFELFPEGDNLTSLFKFENLTDQETVSLPGREYFNVFIYLAEYASYIAEQYGKSAYKFDDISLTDGTIIYRDHTLNQEATFVLDNINLHADGFNSEDRRVTFDLESDINSVGHFDAEWSFDPRDVLEMELRMTTTDFLVVFVSPYTFFHTAHAFVDGKALYEGEVIIHKKRITSGNRIFIEDIEVGKKGFADPPVKLPVRLAVAILRDVDGNIDIELPVTGDLEDPKFRYWPVIMQVLKNNLEKLVTAPFRLLAGMFNVDEVDLKRVQWTYGQNALERPQEKSMQSLAKVLSAKPDLAVTYTELNNRQREREYLALFESKSRYYCAEILKMANCQLNSTDTLEIAKINNQDSLFWEYLKLNVQGLDTTHLASVTELALQLVDALAIDSSVQARIFQRDSIFRQSMIQEHGIVPGRLIKIPIDSLQPMPDTFNLIGPKFILGFDVYDEVDSSQ